MNRTHIIRRSWVAVRLLVQPAAQVVWCDPEQLLKGELTGAAVLHVALERHERQKLGLVATCHGAWSC